MRVSASRDLNIKVPSSFHYLPSQYIVFTFTSLGHCLIKKTTQKNNNVKLVIIKIEITIKLAVFVL